MGGSVDGLADRHSLRQLHLWSAMPWLSEGGSGRARDALAMKAWGLRNSAQVIAQHIVCSQTQGPRGLTLLHARLS